VFPGNVVKYSWAVDKVFIALGRIVDQNGVSMAWKRIHGVREYTVSEEDGSFQAELSGHESLHIELDGQRCDLSLPKIESVDYFLDLGDLVCNPS
jgi:hypothetical protein